MLHQWEGQRATLSSSSHPRRGPPRHLHKPLQYTKNIPSLLQVRAEFHSSSGLHNPYSRCLINAWQLSSMHKMAPEGGSREGFTLPSHLTLYNLPPTQRTELIKKKNPTYIQLFHYPTKRVSHSKCLPAVSDKSHR